uniref:Reverse transcriptase domain-containing protein n=1 Tax=Salix viminalis TaxID=40686 RepID=A0A6N2LM18_SALVM
MKKNKVDVCGLLETKLRSSKVEALQKFQLKRWKFWTNVVASSTARIIIFWNPSTVKVVFVNCSAQGVHVVISSLVSQVSFHATFVYGLYTIVDRRDLWASMRMWCPSGPWLVLGDFNSILSQDDKLNGNVVSMRHSFKFFNIWTSHVDFLTTVSENWHLNVVGSPMFTFCRKLKLVLEDKKLRLQLLNLKLAEKMFFSQKIKCAFLQDSDRAKGMDKIISLRFRNLMVFILFRRRKLELNLWSSSRTSMEPPNPPCRWMLISSALLSAPVSNDDIKTTLFGIGNDKAPGPDGYTSLFFKPVWLFIGDDLCMAINHSVISLIPKSAHDSTPNDFWPISCCNVIYKVILKLLANRLSISLGDIISPMQNAFLGGRAMADNINLVQELLRQYGKKFIHLVMQCVETTSFAIVINGNLYGFFPGKIGIRQGDPLSQYIFITCMEYFSCMLKGVSQHKAFRFHLQCKPHDITNLAFADDVMLLARGDKSSLEIFGKISGLEVNPSKSSIYFGGVGDDLRQEIIHATGFAEGSFPFKYLGVPLSPHRLLVIQFSPLLHKLQAAIQSWVGKHLSYAGRFVLLRFVLYAMVQFWISIFPLLDTVITNILRLFRNFLWTGNVQKSHSALVASKNVCLPKQEDQLVKDCGSSSSVIATMTSWSAGTGCFLANAYEHFRVKGRMIHWDRVVWEPWSLPKHCFVLWIAVLGGYYASCFGFSLVCSPCLALGFCSLENVHTSYYSHTSEQYLTEKEEEVTMSLSSCRRGRKEGDANQGAGYVDHTLGNASEFAQDPLSLPSGSITRLRAKRFKEALNGLIQEIWTDSKKTKMGLNNNQGLVHIIKAIEEGNNYAKTFHHVLTIKGHEFDEFKGCRVKAQPILSTRSWGSKPSFLLGFITIVDEVNIRRSSATVVVAKRGVVVAIAHRRDEETTNVGEDGEEEVVVGATTVKEEEGEVVVVSDDYLKVVIGGVDDEEIENYCSRRWRGRSRDGRLAHEDNSSFARFMWMMAWAVCLCLFHDGVPTLF